MNLRILITKLQCKRFGLPYKKGTLVHILSSIHKFGKIVLNGNFVIQSNAYIEVYKKGCLTIGDNAFINAGVRINCLKQIYIGKNVMIGPYSFITDFNHGYDNPDEPIKNQKLISLGGVNVGDDTWIGAQCIVIGPCNIGKHCVIGVNSVVTKDIPDYCVAVGMPAKIIKKYNSNTKKWEKV